MFREGACWFAHVSSNLQQAMKLRSTQMRGPRLSKCASRQKLPFKFWWDCDFFFGMCFSNLIFVAFDFIASLPVLWKETHTDEFSGSFPDTNWLLILDVLETPILGKSLDVPQEVNWKLECKAHWIWREKHLTPGAGLLSRGGETCRLMEWESCRSLNRWTRDDK